MRSHNIPEIQGNLRKHMIHMPTAIEQVSGLRIFGRLIRSIMFSTDFAVIRNANANAITTNQRIDFPRAYG